LQVNGVPVFVNPESELMENEAAGLRLNPCEDVDGSVKACEIGADEVHGLSQLNQEVVMSVKGVPVLINPESELMDNEMADARINPCLHKDGSVKACEIGPDEIRGLSQVKSVPVMEPIHMKDGSVRKFMI
jgi:hypothetical protein